MGMLYGVSDGKKDASAAVPAAVETATVST
jgi:hypothetical protein